jgi:hypothetical protein
MMNSLTLKWGTLKGWGFSESEQGIKLLREYQSLGSSASAMLQRDTKKQKEIICELIDLCDDGSIYLDWDDKYVTKEEAKEYINNYDR